MEVEVLQYERSIPENMHTTLVLTGDLVPFTYAHIVQGHFAGLGDKR